MKEGTSEILSIIGTMQTLVANFPDGILASVAVKRYTSAIDFLVDCLGAVNISSTDIFSFILSDIIGVNFNSSNSQKINQ